MTATHTASNITHLSFPSGLSIRRAKSRAKELVKSNEFSNLTDALNSISSREMDMLWSEAMAQLNRAAPKNQLNVPNNNPHIVGYMSLEDLKQTLNSHPLLTRFGYGKYRAHGWTREETENNFNENRNKLMTTTALDECNKACMFLAHVEKRKSPNTRQSSYSLKHMVERYMKELPNVDNHYVANGSFICAAIFMGFDITSLRYGNPNVYINASKKSPVFEWLSLRENVKSWRISKIQLKKYENLCILLGVKDNIIYQQ